MKILVTGAAGALGSHMSERLLRDGHMVHALDAFTPYYDRAIKEYNAADVKAAGATWFDRDLTKDDVRDALSGVDAVMHFAAQPGISATTPFNDYLANNIVATQRLLEAMERTAPQARFVNIATSSIYGFSAMGDETTEPKPVSVYGATKLAAEQLVLAQARSGRLSALSLRCFSVYGPRERPEKMYHRLIESILNDTEFPLHEGSRDHVRSFTFAGDVIEGCVRALEKCDEYAGQIFNIGSDTTHTTGEGMDLIQDIIGKSARFKNVPPRPGDQKETHAQIGKIRAAFGYEPKTPLREGLKEQVAWHLRRRSKS